MAVSLEAVSSSQQALVIPDVPIWRLSVAQYHQMIEAGIFTDDDPVELLEGWLVTKMTKNPPHVFSTEIIRELLSAMLPADWFISSQEPVTTLDSEPEPDVMIVSGSRRDYLQQHPQPNDVGLTVEVADATLQSDRTLKLRIYAAAVIPTYWILNLQERQLEVYTEPSGKGAAAIYAARRDYTADESVPVILNEEALGQLKISDLLP